MTADTYIARILSFALVCFTTQLQTVSFSQNNPIEFQMAHFNYLPVDVQEELARTANAIVAAGKGILAADESSGKHFITDH